MDKLENIAHSVPGVRHTQAMTGQSMLLSANGSNFGSMFVILDQFHERPEPVLDRFFVWFKDSVKVLDDAADSVDYSLVTVRTADPSIRTQPYSPSSDRVNFVKVATRRQASWGATRWLKERYGPWLKRRWDGLLGRPDPVVRAPAGSVPPGKPGRLGGRERVEPDRFEERMRKLGLSLVREPARTGKVRPNWFERRVLDTREALGLAWPRPPKLSGDAVANTLRARFAKEAPEAMLTVLGPPPVRGVGRAGGFKVMIEDRGDNGSQTLQGQTEYLVDLCKGEVDGREVAETKGKLVGMTSVFRANVPQVYVDVNRQECMSKDVALKDLFDTMRIYLGSLYVNDFNLYGRTWQVVVQAEPKFRNKIDDVRRLKVRNAQGGMVPVSALADVREDNGPLVLTRYNMYPAAPVNGSAAPGVSSGEAIRLVEDQASNLIGSMAYEWTELAYLEIQAGNTAMIVFGAAVVMVFLVLAAQYESWSMPLAVILVVPMCLLSGVTGVKVSYQDINIFTQIGFVVLVGPGEAERDPDRRVRQAPAGERGRDPPAGRARRVQAAVPADRDDVVRVHPRRRPADPLAGGRGRDAADAGDHRVQRDARGDPLRRLPHPRLLPYHRPPRLDPALPVEGRPVGRRGARDGRRGRPVVGPPPRNRLGDLRRSGLDLAPATPEAQERPAHAPAGVDPPRPSAATAAARRRQAPRRPGPGS